MTLNTGNIRLQDVISVERLQRIQDSFAATMGVASIITDRQGKAVTRPSNFSRVCDLIGKSARGLARCNESDRVRSMAASGNRQPMYHRCLCCGFLDAEAPISIGDERIANWLIGQCRVSGIERSRIREFSEEIGVDTKAILEAFDSMPVFTEEKFGQILELLYNFANEISELGYSNFKMQREIGERRRAEAALRDSEAKVMALLNAPTSTALLIDTECRILALNKTAAGVLGGTVRELIGTDVFKNIDEEVARKRKNHIDRVIKSKKAVRFEDRRGERYLDSNLYPIFGSDGEVAAIAVNAVDITEAKLAHESMVRARDELEQRVQDRTAELAEANREITLERETLRRKNIALQELLDQIEDGKKQMVGQIQSNIDRVIMPIVHMLEEKTEPCNKPLVELLKGNLGDIASPFLNQLEYRFSRLTPREVEICHLIRSGFTSKQIAATLNKSEQTVLKQRKILRKKLGISSRKINLVSYLKRFEQ